ncbi:MAG: chemotaxis protein CheA [Methanosarcinaceae archaeon]|nr:chemotaxis protein CheA [Methanosarcinaceae archaeon]
MESDMAAYKNDFLQETYECLDVFNQSFVDLENGDGAAIDEIFRITHTIKGMAGFLEYKSLESLCHNMEEILCGIKDGDIDIDGNLVDIMLSTVDRITDMVKQIENEDNDSVEIKDLLEAFEGYKKTNEGSQKILCTENPVDYKTLPSEITPVQSSEDTLLDLESKEENETENTCSLEACNIVLDVTLSDDCVMKDLRATLIIESLKDICIVNKTDPDEDGMGDNFNGHFTAFLSGDVNKVEELMDRNTEIEYFNIDFNEKTGDTTSENNNAIPVSNEKTGEKPTPAECKTNVTIVSDEETREVRTDDIYGMNGASIPPVEQETTTISATCPSNLCETPVSKLLAKIRLLLNKINNHIKGFRSTECGGIPGKKGPDFLNGERQSQEVKLSVKNIVDGPEQEIQSLGAQIPDEKIKSDPKQEIQSLGTQIPDEIIESGPEQEIQSLESLCSEGDAEECRVQELQLLEKNSGDIPKQELQLDEVQHIEEINEESPGQGSELKENPVNTKLKIDSNKPLSNSTTNKLESSGTKIQETIRVKTSNLDSIMNLVGELVINKGRLLQISQEYDLPELDEATGALDKSISSLQDEVMRIRMVKIDRVVSKFPRMVRDLSRKLDKNIDFEIEGQDTELDKTIIDKINDPLVHLVRNAVDHGIESHEERKNAGKSEIGHIKLSARREKNNVIIEIEDDGKGLDLELLKKKAIEKGLFSAFDLENFSDDEVRMLIFTPGFSTKESATEISGRGVGMDAVKTAVANLGGKVRIYSNKGEYTKIRIDLPPTVAIIKSLLVKVGAETYAIPISNVVKALSVDSKDYKLINEKPLIYIGDKIIPVLELKDIFNIQCDKLEKVLAIIVEMENEEVGLIVDSIIDQQEIVIKPLGQIFSNIKGFIGVTILGDGRVIPILDVSVLIRGDIDD